jgi:catechol 2,3-dioxygenase-like lactoylglutathione lyase family enzyme
VDVEEAERASPRLTVVSLWAEDVLATAHFYRDVIGLSLAAHHAGRPHFDLGGAYLVILRGRPLPAEDPEPSRFPVIALRVDDFQAALDRLSAADVPLPWGVEEDADSRWVMFQDPGGNLIEIVDVRLGAKREA